MIEKHNLLNQTVNRILDQIQSVSNADPFLPSELSLSKGLDVSRTTIRKAINILIEKDIISVLNGKKMISRKITKSDYISVSPGPTNVDDKMHLFFMDQIKNGDIRPGTTFSVLQLANESGFNRTIVRDFLYSFSKFGLIEKLPRKNWRMVKIDRKYLEELTDVRMRLEIDAAANYIEADNDPVILLKIQTIVRSLSVIPDPGAKSGQQVIDLEKDFFEILFLSKPNRFIRDFYSRLFFTFSVLDNYCMMDTSDFAYNKYVLLTSLLESLIKRVPEEFNSALNDYYGSNVDIYIEAIEMLEFP